jgi:hypothetical protein
MRYKLYHVGIHPEGPIDPKALEKAFDFAGDWLRLNQFNWYVWTKQSAVHLTKLLEPLVGPNGSLVIMQIDTSADSDRWGFAPRAVWDWINDKRDKALLETG